MRICVNGVVRDMSPDEIAEHKALEQDIPAPLPTTDERLEALERAMLEILGVNVDG